MNIECLVASPFSPKKYHRKINVVFKPDYGILKMVALLDLAKYELRYIYATPKHGMELVLITLDNSFLFQQTTFYNGNLKCRSLRFVERGINA